MKKISILGDFECFTDPHITCIAEIITTHQLAHTSIDQLEEGRIEPAANNKLSSDLILPEKEIIGDVCNTFHDKEIESSTAQILIGHETSQSMVANTNKECPEAICHSKVDTSLLSIGTSVSLQLVNNIKENSPAIGTDISPVTSTPAYSPHVYSLEASIMYHTPPYQTQF